MSRNTSAGGPSRSGRRIAGRAQRDHIIDPYQVQQKLQARVVLQSQA